jgi:hypothetical protein
VTLLAREHGIDARDPKIHGGEPGIEGREDDGDAGQDARLHRERNLFRRGLFSSLWDAFATVAGAVRTLVEVFTIVVDAVAAVVKAFYPIEGSPVLEDRWPTTVDPVFTTVEDGGSMNEGAVTKGTGPAPCKGTELAALGA